MELAGLLHRVTAALEELDIPHLVTDSMATIAYGEPRFTRDIDVVVPIEKRDIQRLRSAFPEEEFYLSPEAAFEALEHSGQFNVLHPRSGLKIDFMVAGPSEFDERRFSRSRRLQIGPSSAAEFAAPEDVVIKKLEYYREGESEKHLRDIAGVVRVMGDDLDREYIEAWVRRLDLESIWQHVLDRITPEP
jgi:hypothetical protein